MNRILLYVGGGLAGLALLFFGFFWYTKSRSPQETAVLKNENIELSITYSRPFKKGREIFGKLEPYGKVWRTGANEATVLTVNKAIELGDKTLPAGKYSLFTIPNPEKWTVILNKETGQWGLSHNPAQDAAQVVVPAEKLPETIEQFTITPTYDAATQQVVLALAWDNTVVRVPIKVK